MQGVPVHSLLSTAPLILKRQPNGDMTGPASGQKPMIREGSHFTLITLVGQPQAQYGVRSTQETVSWQCVACGRPTHRLANGHEPLIPDTWGMDTVQSLFVSSIQDMPTAPERDIHQASEVSSSWTEVPDPPSRSTLLQLQTSTPSGNLHLGTYGHSRHSLGLKKGRTACVKNHDRIWPRTIVHLAEPLLTVA